MHQGTMLRGPCTCRHQLARVGTAPPLHSAIAQADGRSLVITNVSSRPFSVSGPTSWGGTAASRRDLSVVGPHSAGGVGTNGGLAPVAAPDQLTNRTVLVRFHLKYRTSFGQAVKVLGSHAKLGNWKLANAVEMRWTTGDQWVAIVELPAGAVYEYKYVLIDYATKQAIEWQAGSNAVLAVVVSETEVDVYDNWGNAPGAVVKVDNQSMTRESKLLKWSSEMMGYWKEARRLQIEVAQHSNEVSGVRGELAALKMELSMERQARAAAEQQAMDLQVDNANLKQQLVQKTVELNNTLKEVLQLLDKELEESENEEYDEYYDDDYYEAVDPQQSAQADHNANGNGNGKNSNSENGNGSQKSTKGRSQSPKLVASQAASRNGNGVR